MGTNIQTGNKIEAISPSNAAELLDMSELLAGSNLVPDAYQKKPGDIAVAIMQGLEVGLKPMQALQGIAVIKGKPTIWGDALPALVLGQGKGHKIEEKWDGDGDNLTAICICTRGDTSTVHTQSFGVIDAKKAGLWGTKTKSGADTVWSKYPRRMLQMRARAWAVRDAFPDCLMGLSVREEVQDYAPMRDITPAQPAAAAVARGDNSGVRAIPTAKPVTNVAVVETVEEISNEASSNDVENLKAQPEDSADDNTREEEISTGGEPSGAISDQNSAQQAGPQESTKGNKDQGSDFPSIWFLIKGEQQEEVSEEKFAEQLIHWYGNEKITFDQAKAIQDAHLDQIKDHPKQNEIGKAYMAAVGTQP